MAEGKTELPPINKCCHMRKRNHCASWTECTKKGMVRVSQSRLMFQQQVWERKEGLNRQGYKFSPGWRIK